MTLNSFIFIILVVAVREADGIKVDGTRIVVDVERGRTVKEWLPRRLGGGYKPTDRRPPSANSRSIPPPPPARGEERRKRSRSRDRDHYGGGSKRFDDRRRRY